MLMKTANPCADAERWMDEEARRDAQVQAAQIKATEAAIDALTCKPEQWFQDGYVGGLYTSPEEMLADVVGEKTVREALGALMTSPAAQALRQAVAQAYGANNWQAITHV